MRSSDENPMTMGERRRIACKPLPTAARLRELFRYEPDTGEFVRLMTTTGTGRAGSIAGCVDSDGRRIIRVDGGIFKAYRLAWVYMTGIDPVGMIDHRNGDSSDDRFENLRDVDEGMNSENRRECACTNKVGLLGVTINRYGEGFKAAIKSKGKSYDLGVFPTELAAHEAYVSAKRQMHGGCTI